MVAVPGYPPHGKGRQIVPAYPCRVFCIMLGCTLATTPVEVERLCGQAVPAHRPGWPQICG